MLFSSPEFLFIFLPVTVAAAFAAGARFGRKAGYAVLVLASVVYYGWAYPPYVLLLFASIAGNYVIGMTLSRQARRSTLAAGIVFNLALLAYFKYAHFLADTVSSLTGAHYMLDAIALPLAISFFTFQQIAYLVDVYQGKARDSIFLHYALFVVFFPQLIAGPIVHHAEMMNQFNHRDPFRPNALQLAVGGAIFLVGLYKKAVFADGISVYADGVFAGALQNPTFFEAWGGALAYAFQIYFDFSGYSDMAIGLAFLFGIRLPLNFHSPYKATSIIDFWRRWHMTLSRFLRDYLYVPLGGNRRGLTRRHVNLMVVMLLGGLWHGAAWTFFVWGGLHGVFLIVNHAWRALVKAVFGAQNRSTWIGRAIGRTVTFLAVVVAWVFFRAENFESAFSLLRGMAGLNGVVLTQSALAAVGGADGWLRALGVEAGRMPLLDPAAFLWLASLLLIVWAMPNTQQWFAAYAPSHNHRAVMAALGESDSAPRLLTALDGLSAQLAGTIWTWRVPAILWIGGVSLLVLAVRRTEAPFIYMFF